MESLVGMYLSFCLFLWILNTQASGEFPAMNSASFDDQYQGCEQQMEREVMFSLLNKEKKADPDFRKIWEDAEQEWKEMKSRRIRLPSSFQDAYGVALVAYTNSKSQIQQKFQKAMNNYDRKNFRYHSLHFLLTRAMDSLRSRCGWSPWLVHRTVCGVRQNLAYVGQEVRFGHFFSSARNKWGARVAKNETLLTITSCFGADIKEFSFLPIEEFLIPPDEVFRVKRVTKNTLELETTKTRCHYYNCDYLCEVTEAMFDSSCCGSMTEGHCFASQGTKMVSSSFILTLLVCRFLYFTIKDIATF